MAERKADHKELTATEARQGVKAHRVNRVLIISVLLAAVALGIALSVLA